MRPDQKDLAFLWDMWDAAKAIQEFAEGKTFHHYLNERMLRGAVERHLEIIARRPTGFPRSLKRHILKFPGIVLLPSAMLLRMNMAKLNMNLSGK